jgi:hypothetical protein
VGLRALACWVRGFESRRGHGCLTLVSVVCCQVEVSASDRPLVQRSPTDCGVSECDVSECGVSECGVSECGVSECGVSECGVSECVCLSVIVKPRRGSS